MKKVLVGLSGGVDSAVAAYLLKEQGYDVTCAFMRNWDSMANEDFAGNPTLNDDVCPQEADYHDAQAVAEKLGLELLRIDFVKEYWDDVFKSFLAAYRVGETPNPDILCNKYIKFNTFMSFARSRGFETVATGHYARTGLEGDTAVLKKALDLNKDQSYFLAEIDRHVLKDVIFPLGEIEKPEVRRIAGELDLAVAAKKDSTGICFIGERHFREFLSNYLPMKPGRIINIANRRTVGTHKGVMYYTIGQRKGLDIGGIGPFYVCGKDVEKNELYVTDEQHQDWLYSDACIIEGYNTMADREYPLTCAAKFRYRQPDQPVTVRPLDENRMEVRFIKPVRSVTAGQEAVIYDGDTLIGGGRIASIFKEGEDLMAKVRQEGSAQ
jgi:tRNA-specific 2-thiouridylase